LNGGEGGCKMKKKIGVSTNFCKEKSQASKDSKQFHNYYTKKTLCADIIAPRIFWFVRQKSHCRNSQEIKNMISIELWSFVIIQTVFFQAHISLK